MRKSCNLDYKIVLGNSLLGFPFKSQRLQDIETLKQRFFSEADHEMRADLKRQIDAKIRECLEASAKSLGYVVTFDFEVVFSEVFDNGTGFDVVIANPPYGVRIPSKSREAYALNLGPIPDFEIFYWFLSLAAKISRQGGMLSYIIPNTFLLNMYAADYRRLFLERWRLHTLVDLTSLTIFESAVIRNCVVICERRDKVDYTAVICTFGVSERGDVTTLKSLPPPKNVHPSSGGGVRPLVRSRPGNPAFRVA